MTPTLNLFQEMPLVAILRGILPTEVVAVGQVLYKSGIRCIEVPLNSPAPLDSIAKLVAVLPEDCLVGAGTVTSASDVDDVVAAGGNLIVAPNTDKAVIQRAVGFDALVMPGIATATDAFNAISYGARHLKLFPASTYGPDHMRSLKVVLPDNCRVYAVGGVGVAEMGMWVAAGVDGFGIGSEIYRAGDSAEVVSEKANALTSAYRNTQTMHTKPHVNPLSKH
jgi:2-dehydro-3-deoxyphosphogalactonate aldolase